MAFSRFSKRLAIALGMVMGAIGMSLSPFGGGAAWAQAGVSAPLTPLVVVRFNQRNVYFDRPLYAAASKAMAIKPGVLFDLLAISPRTGDTARDKEYALLAWQNAKAVEASLTRMGVPANQVTVLPKSSRGVASTEVHVFVR